MATDVATPAESPSLVADVEQLPFPDFSFETVLATCVFCTVAQPVEALREVRRVVKPTGR